MVSAVQCHCVVAAVCRRTLVPEAAEGGAGGPSRPNTLTTRPSGWKRPLTVFSARFFSCVAVHSPDVRPTANVTYVDHVVVFASAAQPSGEQRPTEPGQTVFLAAHHLPVSYLCHRCRGCLVCCLTVTVPSVSVCPLCALCVPSVCPSLVPADVFYTVDGTDPRAPSPSRRSLATPVVLGPGVHSLLVADVTAAATPPTARTYTVRSVKGQVILGNGGATGLADVVFRDDANVLWMPATNGTVADEHLRNSHSGILSSNRLTPLPGATAVTAVGVSTETLFVVSDGVLYGWGACGLGQVGPRALDEDQCIPGRVLSPSENQTATIPDRYIPTPTAQLGMQLARPWQVSNSTRDAGIDATSSPAVLASESNAAVPVAGGAVATIVATAVHTVVLTDGGVLSTFGSCGPHLGRTCPGVNQTFDANPVVLDTFLDVDGEPVAPAPTNVLSVSANEYMTAVAADGVLYTFGQCQNLSEPYLFSYPPVLGRPCVNEGVPTAVGGALRGKYVTHVSVAPAAFDVFHVLVVADGELFGFGTCSWGQLGDAYPCNVVHPFPVPTDNATHPALVGTVSSATAAGLVSLAVVDGTVFSVGACSGPLGRQCNASSPAFHLPWGAVPSLPAVATVRAASYVAAVVADGEVWSWGVHGGSTFLFAFGDQSTPSTLPRRHETSVQNLLDVHVSDSLFAVVASPTGVVGWDVQELVITVESSADFLVRGCWFHTPRAVSRSCSLRLMDCVSFVLATDFPFVAYFAAIPAAGRGWGRRRGS